MLDSVLGLFTGTEAEMFDGLISSMTVSRRVGECLVECLHAFENRRIENTPLMLVIDGIWLKMKIQANAYCCSRSE